MPFSLSDAGFSANGISLELEIDTRKLQTADIGFTDGCESIYRSQQRRYSSMFQKAHGQVVVTCGLHGEEGTEE